MPFNINFKIYLDRINRVLKKPSWLDLTHPCWGGKSKFEIILGIGQLIGIFAIFVTLVINITAILLARSEAEARTRPYVGIAGITKDEEVTDDDVYYRIIGKNWGDMPAYDVRFTYLELVSSELEEPKKYRPTKNPKILFREHSFYRKIDVPKDVLQSVVEKEETKAWAHLKIKIEYSFNDKPYSFESEYRLTDLEKWAIHGAKGD
jgi:hypothetical protein